MNAAKLGAAVDFNKEIRPLLQERCVECHGSKKVKANLRLDAKAHALRGGESGPALIAGQPEKSAVLQRITTEDADQKMPPKGERLSPAQVALVRRWIEEGAEWPEDDADRAAARDPRLDHWSVQPLRTDFGSAKSVDDFIKTGLKAPDWRSYLPRPTEEH